MSIENTNTVPLRSYSYGLNSLSDLVYGSDATSPLRPPKVVFETHQKALAEEMVQFVRHVWNHA